MFLNFNESPLKLEIDGFRNFGGLRERESSVDDMLLEDDEQLVSMRRHKVIKLQLVSISIAKGWSHGSLRPLEPYVGWCDGRA
jgi:hypothetical protein